MLVFLLFTRVCAQAMRVFVEAVLRFGLPVDFSSTLLLVWLAHSLFAHFDTRSLPRARTKSFALCSNSSTRICQPPTSHRCVLSKRCSPTVFRFVVQALDSSEMDISGFGADFYPYVYLQINLTD